MPPVTTADTQHLEQQASSSSSASILKERRFKLSRACDRCRRRRIKCDEGHPCQACLTANSACTFEEPGKRTHPHKSKRTATLEDRMHHLETLIQAIPPAVFAAGGILPPTIPPSHMPALQENPHSPVTPFVYPAGLPSGVPPPSLHVFPLMNPSTHFTRDEKPQPGSPHASFGISPHTLLHGYPQLGLGLNNSNNPQATTITPDQLAEETSRMSLTASYLYFDDEGYTRWQGETSGLPVLDLLVERHTPAENKNRSEHQLHPHHRHLQQQHQHQQAQQQQKQQLGDLDSMSVSPSATPNTDWFPNRTPRRTDVNPQTLWKLITSCIMPELMDSLVQCYLSTSYYILPFLHVPTFLADYGNPQKWGEPGFAAFIVAICCLASRHMDDPRVRADPHDGISAGTQWFELFNRLRTLPIADRPTLYNIQGNLIAAVYAVGLGKISKAAALLGESITMCIDAGLHRSADTYDIFDAIEDEVRKRTFWCIYIWDKQLSAHFGRPAMLRLRDCDVSEPAPVDDECITRDGVSPPPQSNGGTECRLSAFIVSLRIMVVLESVLDVPPARQADDPSSSFFLLRATNVLSGSNRRFKEMREEEALLDDINRNIPMYWAHSQETLSSEDTIRLTQAERLHCAEQFVRLLIYRHRFSELVAERTAGGSEDEQREEEKEAMIAAHNSALEIVAAHLNIAKKGLMTYYGVHVIHQLTQAGRTLVAILLCCKTDALQYLIPPGLDALRSCIGLLRRFSGRYVCGLRSGDLMEEFCRLTNIPLETTRDGEGVSNTTRPPWIRPIRKKAASSPANATNAATTTTSRSTRSDDSASQHSSPEAFSPSDFFVDSVNVSPPNNANGGVPTVSGATGVSATTGTVAGPGARPGSGGSSDVGSPSQYGNAGNSQGGAGFMDSSVDVAGGNRGGVGGGGGRMDMIREDTPNHGHGMYMSPEMMALFDASGGVGVGGVPGGLGASLGVGGTLDVGHLFSAETFLQQATSPTHLQQQQRQYQQHQQHQQQQRQGQNGFVGAGYMKLNGLVTSP